MDESLLASVRNGSSTVIDKPKSVSTNIDSNKSALSLLRFSTEVHAPMLNHLHNILYQRLMCLSSHSRNTEDSEEKLETLRNWWVSEKSKVQRFCEKSKPLSNNKMKALSDYLKSLNPEEVKNLLGDYGASALGFNSDKRNRHIDESHATARAFESINKREMKPYEVMHRTSYREFFKPADRVQEYQKDAIVTEADYIEKNSAFLERSRKSCWSVKLENYETFRSKQQDTPTLKYAQTRNAMSQSAIVLSTVRKQPLTPSTAAPSTDKKLLISQKEVIRIIDSERQRKANQQLAMAQMVKQPKFQEDEPDENAIEFVDSETDSQNSISAKFQVQSRTRDVATAKQYVKDPNQSTLKRIIRDHEDTKRSKLEDLDIAEQMRNWAAVKSRQHSLLNAKMERKFRVSRFPEMEHQNKQSNQQQSPNKPLSNRIVSSSAPKLSFQIINLDQIAGATEQQLPLMENDIARQRLRSIISAHKIILNHHLVASKSPESAAQGQSSDKQTPKVETPANLDENAELISQSGFYNSNKSLNFSKTLTSHIRPSRHQSMSKILAQNSIEKYNESAIQAGSSLKAKLARVQSHISNEKTIKGLSVVGREGIKKLIGMGTSRMVATDGFFNTSKQGSASLTKASSKMISTQTQLTPSKSILTKAAAMVTYSKSKTAKGVLQLSQGEVEFPTKHLPSNPFFPKQSLKSKRKQKKK